MGKKNKKENKSKNTFTATLRATSNCLSIAHFDCVCVRECECVLSIMLAITRICCIVAVAVVRLKFDYAKVLQREKQKTLATNSFCMQPIMKGNKNGKRINEIIYHSQSTWRCLATTSQQDDATRLDVARCSP